MKEQIVNEYNEMLDSIEKYGGFYVGRYELTGTLDNPTIKKGRVITNVDWYSLYKACKLVNSSDIVKTRMIYGWQWDIICNWLSINGYNITNSNSWGNYSDSTGEAALTGYGLVQDTGYSEYWKANNIYDLVGNCIEWTQEAYSTSHRVRRGGVHDTNNDSVISKRNCYPIVPYDNQTTHCMLFISV